MGVRLSRFIAVCALLALVATACAGQTTAGTAGDAPESLASTEGVEAEVTTTTEVRLDRVVVVARDDISSSPLWIADSEGFFAANGIEVVFRPVTNASELTSVLSRSEAQVAVDSSATAIFRAERFLADISIVAYLEATRGDTRTASGTMSLVAPAVNAGDGWTGCELVGQRIGVDSLTSLQTIALRAMFLDSPCGNGEGLDVTSEESAEADVSTDEDTPTGQGDSTDESNDGEEEGEIIGGGIELVELDAVSLKVALQNGDVDAGVFTEPNTSRLLRENESDDIEVRVSVVADLHSELCSGLRCPTSVAIAANSWVESNPDVVRRFNLAINESIEWIRNNDLDYRAALVSCCALTTSDASEIPRPKLIGARGDLVAELPRIVDVLVDQGVITNSDVVQDLVPTFE